MKKMQNDKYYFIDFWRFVFILMIMAGHIHTLGERTTHFWNSWIYVEFFFMVTGFFTTKHFYKRNMACQNEIFQYTIKKFKKFVPYVLFSTFITYIVYFYDEHLFSKTNIIIYIESFISENLLISSAGEICAKNSPLWFLSAMFLVMPFYLFFITDKSIQVLFHKYFCWLFPAIYYAKMGVIDYLVWPHALLRAFAGMCLGTFIFEVSHMIRSKNIYNRIVQKTVIRTILTIVEIGCFTVTIILTWYTQNTLLNRLIIYLLIFGMILLFSGETYTFLIRNWKAGEIFGYLGRLSMLLFLFHWPIGCAIRVFFSSLNKSNKILLYYISSLLFCIIIDFLITGLKKIKIMNISINSYDK